MSTFDEDLFLKGLEQRKATLGADYVEGTMAAADDFSRPFQEAMTAWCWGFGWGDDAIEACAMEDPAGTPTSGGSCDSSFTGRAVQLPTVIAISSTNSLVITRPIHRNYLTKTPA